MTSLPDSYFIAAALFFAILAYSVANIRAAWAFPYGAVVATVGAWYLIEPIYFGSEFSSLGSEYVSRAFDSVIVFFVIFAALALISISMLSPNRDVVFLKSRAVGAEQALMVFAVAWLFLLAYGVSRMEGDLFGALFPLGGRSSSNMWSRAAGADAGASGFLVATAQYIYILCLAAFGVLLCFVRAAKYQVLALILISLAWPYAFLQGSRNVALAVVVPGAAAYLLYGKQGLAIRVGICAVAALAIEYAFRVVIAYRNTGFGGVNLEEAGGASHLGLNMASELVYSIQFVEQGTLQVSYGLGYLAELANVVPRAIWADKPLIGNDFAIARGFGGVGNDIGVFATISTGMIGQGVLNFGPFFGAIASAGLMAFWVGMLTRFRRQGTPLRLALFLVGLGLTFNLGRDITLLVIWPMIFGYLGVRFLESRERRALKVVKQRRATGLASTRVKARRPAPPREASDE